MILSGVYVDGRGGVPAVLAGKRVDVLTASRNEKGFRLSVVPSGTRRSPGFPCTISPFCLDLTSDDEGTLLRAV